MALALPAAAESDKRQLPDYDGRGQAITPGEVALWVPRILLLPPYLLSEYVVRRPVGALITAAEHAGLSGLLYDFFTFGPDHRAGIVPIGFIDFGVEPSIGAYAFWDDAFTRGHDLRMHATTWGSDWLAAAFADRIHLGRDPRDLFALEASFIRRPDYTFFGLGPRSRQDDLMRYGADTLEARLGIDKRLWRSSSFRSRIGVRANDFHAGGYAGDPRLADAIRAGTLSAPPGYASGYTLLFETLTAALDTRPPQAATGTGVRLEAEASLDSDLRQVASFIDYRAAAGAFLDLNQHGRVVSLSLVTRFVDPLGHAKIPFTELAQLGGFAPMRGFYVGRLIDRSAAVLQLAYRWPIWVWLDGSMHFELGNVFGPHLENFELSLLRFSSSIGVESRQSPDNSLQVLFGLGSETFAAGGKIDSFRIVVGTTHGF